MAGEPGTSCTALTLVFCLGGPGSGKGTQCARLAQNGWIHLSIGDILRAEQSAGTKNSALVEECLREARIVPKELATDLLANALWSSAAQGAKVIIDGFPRSMDRALLFESRICSPALVLYLACPERVLMERVLERGKASGRVDDNAATIEKRFFQFSESSLPVLDHYQSRGLLAEIDASKPPDDVAFDIDTALRAVLAISSRPLGQEGTTTTMSVWPPYQPDFSCYNPRCPWRREGVLRYPHCRYELWCTIECMHEDSRAHQKLCGMSAYVLEITNTETAAIHSHVNFQDAPIVRRRVEVPTMASFESLHLLICYLFRLDHRSDSRFVLPVVGSELPVLDITSNRDDSDPHTVREMQQYFALQAYLQGETLDKRRPLKVNLEAVRRTRGLGLVQLDLYNDLEYWHYGRYESWAHSISFINVNHKPERVPARSLRPRVLAAEGTAPFIGMSLYEEDGEVRGLSWTEILLAFRGSHREQKKEREVISRRVFCRRTSGFHEGDPLTGRGWSPFDSPKVELLMEGL